MSTAVKILRGFVRVWIWAVIVVFLISVAGIWWKDGVGKVFDVLSPFNAANYVVTIILLLPALGAHMLADRLSKRPPSKPVA